MISEKLKEIDACRCCGKGAILRDYISKKRKYEYYCYGCYFSKALEVWNSLQKGSQCKPINS